MSKILVGSAYFFQGMEGFEPDGYDYVEVVENGYGYNYLKEAGFLKNNEFTIVKRPVEELIEYAKTHNPAIQIGKFLVPEVCEALEFTLENLNEFADMFEAMPEKYQYLNKIYQAYVKNGSMTLTNAQRKKIYQAYVNSHPIQTEPEKKREESVKWDPTVTYDPVTNTLKPSILKQTQE